MQKGTQAAQDDINPAMAASETSVGGLSQEMGAIKHLHHGPKLGTGEHIWVYLCDSFS